MTGKIIPGGFAFLTLVFAVIGVATGDARWYLASGLGGTLWWLWDFVADYVFAPIGELFFRVLQGDSDLPPANVRPTGEETIGLLEERVERTVSAESDVHAALQLADLYRAFQKDPMRARAVIEMMRARYPDDTALQRYEDRADGR